MKSLAGHLLIASPEMVDDYFSNTVVLVINHSPEGAAGVVLNKPSDVPLSTVWQELDDTNDSHAKDLINIGGPCEGPLIAIHNSLAYAEISLIPGVAMSVRLENLKQLVKQSHQTVRLYSGYAGWSPNQLDSEIIQGGWYSIPARPPLIFGDTGAMWRSAFGRFGDSIISSVAGKHVPKDPSLN